MIANKSISLCYVAYNSSELITKSIESVKEIVDEIIIIDQGSNVEESAKLRKLATFYSYTTNKGNADYDRMFCYSLATKEYILALDSDELITIENIEKLKKLMFRYDFDVLWFLFENIINNGLVKINLKDKGLFGDDPHPRLWKRTVNINGQVVPTIVWSSEAHQFPQINTVKQIYGELYVRHERELADVIKTHLHRGKNISPQMQQVEREFIKKVLDCFGDEVKNFMVNGNNELKVYLKG
jgi:glycosyltransferase involved in cell wall biosynthesis